MKRFLINTFLGIAVGTLILWAADALIGKNYLSRIQWKSVFVYIFFLAGFIWAFWLNVWFKFANRFIWKKGKKEVSKSAPTTPLQTNRQPTGMARPAAMAVQTGALMSVNPAQATAATTAAPVPPAPVTPSTQTGSNKENDIAMLSNIDPDLDMMAFKHVALEGKIIDLVYSSDDVAVLCKLFSDEHTWTVNISGSLDQCQWINEAGGVLNPCTDLLAQAAILEKMETEAEIIPTIVLMRGTIQNYQAVQEYLLQNNIYLVQYESNGEPNVRLLHDLLKEKFVLFPATESSEEEEVTDGDTEEESDQETIAEEENDTEEEYSVEEESPPEEDITEANPEGGTSER